MLTAIVSIGSGGVKHYWYEDRNEAFRAALAMSKQGGHGDLYWSMAEFTDRKRSQDNAAQLKNFWLDLDCGEGKGYATKAEALKAFIQSGLPEPTIVVDSGNGLHLYWTLHEAVPAEDWQPVAEHFKRACITKGLDADHAITADAARILRVPGTHNMKDPDNPQPVKLLRRSGTKYTLDGFQQTLPSVGPLRDAKPKGEPDEWSVDAADFPPAQIENVLQGCKQVREAAKVQSAGIAEPYWRAVLSVVYRCDGGEDLIHKISQGDPRYDAEETERKAENTAGPATCEHFSAVNPGGCAGCPFAGAVRSPISIPAPAPQPEESEEAPERPSKVNDWHITAKGVYKAMEADDGSIEKQFASLTPVYGETFRSRRGETDMDADDAKLLLVWLRPDGRWRRTLMPLSLIGSPTKMMEWAGGQGLATLIPNAKVWNMYISELTNKLLAERQVTEYYARLGWHADDSEFVLGTHKVTADGLEATTIERNGPLAQLAPQGDLEEWKAGIDLLNRPGLEKHQFCILAGFGSPLLQLMDVAGAAISLAGASGRGKTLAARAALSIYGQPDALFQSADATKNSTDMHLATLHSVPYLMDEVTSLADKQIGNLLYMIANGRGKDSLNRARDWRTGGNWRLVAFLTTNNPIMEANQTHLTEAQRNRAIELIIDTAVPSDIAAQIYQATSKHYGLAAAKFMQYVIQHRDEVTKLTHECVDKVKGAFEGQDAQRFGVWALAAALAGGMVARKLELIKFDPWEIVQEIVPNLQEQGERTLTPEEQFVEAVREWLTEYSDRVTTTLNGGLGFADDPIAKLDGPDIYVHSTRFRKALRERQVSLQILRRYLGKYGETNIKQRLAKGTPPVTCIRLPRDWIYGEED